MNTGYNAIEGKKHMDKSNIQKLREIAGDLVSNLQGLTDSDCAEHLEQVRSLLEAAYSQGYAEGAGQPIFTLIRARIPLAWRRTKQSISYYVLRKR
jgi:hypothetical protein